MSQIKAVRSFIIVAFAALFFGCATTPQTPPGPIATTPDEIRAALRTFKEGETTPDEVKSKLGTPVHEDYNPDGRFVYSYRVDKGVLANFLFGKDKKLIRIAGYSFPE